METTIQEHRHNGLGDQRLNLVDILGMVKTVSVAPTHTPRSLLEQVLIYSNGATYRFYWYDTINKAWRYATGA